MLFRAPFFGFGAVADAGAGNAYGVGDSLLPDRCPKARNPERKGDSFGADIEV